MLHCLHSDICPPSTLRPSFLAIDRPDKPGMHEGSDASLKVRKGRQKNPEFIGRRNIAPPGTTSLLGMSDFFVVGATQCWVSRPRRIHKV